MQIMYTVRLANRGNLSSAVVRPLSDSELYRAIPAASPLHACEIWASLVEWSSQTLYDYESDEATVEVTQLHCAAECSRFTVSRHLRPIFIARPTEEPIHAPAAIYPQPDSKAASGFAIGCAVRVLATGEIGTVARVVTVDSGVRVIVVDHPLRNGSRRKCYDAAELEICDAN